MPTYRDMERWYNDEKAKRSKAEQDNEKLAEANVGLAAIAKAAQAERDALVKKMDAAKRESKAQTGKVQALEAELDKAAIVLKDAQQEITRLTTACAKAGHDLDQSNRLADQLRVKLSASEDEAAKVGDLRKALAASQAQDTSEAETLRKELTAQKRQNAKSLRRIDKLKADLAEAQIMLADADGQKTRAILRGKMRGGANGF